MKRVAERGLAHCRNHFGSKGLKVEQEIDGSISWRPSFHLKPHPFRILAVEVEDNLYPEALKGAAHDIRHFNQLISVYQLCSLEAYQADKDHKKINTLKRHGFGIITVSDDGEVVIQHQCVPLIQHITQDEFEAGIKQLPVTLKVLFRSAFGTYVANPRQGVQEAAQIVEGLVYSIARQGVASGSVPAGILNKVAAFVVDDLWAAVTYIPYRAALGGARNFLQRYRNPTSHSPKNAKEAAAITREYRAGFLASMSEAVALAETIHKLKYKVRIYAA